MRKTEYRLKPSDIDAMTLEQIALYNEEDEGDPTFGGQCKARADIDAWRKSEAEALGMTLEEWQAEQEAREAVGSDQWGNPLVTYEVWKAERSKGN